jgi:hypothetical protein
MFQVGFGADWRGDVFNFIHSIDGEEGKAEATYSSFVVSNSFDFRILPYFYAVAGLNAYLSYRVRYSTNPEILLFTGTRSINRYGLTVSTGLQKDFPITEQIILGIRSVAEKNILYDFFGSRNYFNIQTSLVARFRLD